MKCEMKKMTFDLTAVAYLYSNSSVATDSIKSRLYMFQQMCRWGGISQAPLSVRCAGCGVREREGERERESGQECGALKHGFDLVELELTVRASLIPFGHKLVKNRNAWKTSRHTQRVMKSQALPRPSFPPLFLLPLLPSLSVFVSLSLSLSCPHSKRKAFLNRST